MKPNSGTKQMSPVNIDQNRLVGQDSPAEGSRMGREANKEHGYPGEEEQSASEGGTAAGSTESAGTSHLHAASSPSRTRDDEVREAAYEAYQRRGSGPGSDVEDWLNAEARVDRQRSD